MEGGAILRKLLLIFLAAVLMLPLYTQSATASNIDQIIGQINQAIVDTYGEEFRDEFPKSISIDTDGDGVRENVALNQHLFNTRKIIVYGCPRDDFGPDNFDPATGHNRY